MCLGFWGSGTTSEEAILGQWRHRIPAKKWAHGCLGPGETERIGKGIWGAEKLRSP